MNIAQNLAEKLAFVEIGNGLYEVTYHKTSHMTYTWLTNDKGLIHRAMTQNPRCWLVRDLVHRIITEGELTRDNEKRLVTTRDVLAMIDRDGFSRPIASYPHRLISKYIRERYNCSRHVSNNVTDEILKRYEENRSDGRGSD